MADLDYENEELAVIDGVDDPPVSDSDAPLAVAPFEHLDASGAGVDFELDERDGDAPLHGLVELAELLLGVGIQGDPLVLLAHAVALPYS